MQKAAKRVAKKKEVFSIATLSHPVTLDTHLARQNPILSLIPRPNIILIQLIFRLPKARSRRDVVGKAWVVGARKRSKAWVPEEAGGRFDEKASQLTVGDSKGGGYDATTVKRKVAGATHLDPPCHLKTAAIRAQTVQ